MRIWLKIEVIGSQTAHEDLKPLIQGAVAVERHMTISQAFNFCVNNFFFFNTTRKLTKRIQLTFPIGFGIKYHKLGRDQPKLWWYNPKVLLQQLLRDFTQIGGYHQQTDLYHRSMFQVFGVAAKKDMVSNTNAIQTT